MSKMDYQGQNVDHYFSLFVSYMEVDLKPTTLSSTLLLQAVDAIWTKTHWHARVTQNSLISYKCSMVQLVEITAIFFFFLIDKKKYY